LLSVSEPAHRRTGDVSLSLGAHCKVLGKERNTRSVPLTRETVAMPAIWLQERGSSDPEPVLPR
jgi:hypothetical protein